jgi:serine/threonine protein kinase
MSMLDDRYELLRVIGRGGAADVYAATDQVLGRDVAVKVLRAVSADDSDRQRFIAEARTLAALDHPHLMTVLDAGADGDRLYLVLSLIEGRSLGERPREPMPLKEVAAILAQIADALAYAHDQGVIHRDVKPGNVLVDDDGYAWLGDFGISRVVGEAVRHTETGKLIGTAAYLAPEQVRGTELSAAADVYSLGLVALELITGVLSYPGPPVEAALARLSTQPDVPAYLPKGWSDLLRAMTAQEPHLRCTASECAAALRSLADGQDPVTSVAAYGPPTEAMDAPYAPSGTRPRRRRMLGVVAVAVAALIASGVVLSGGDADPDPSPPQIPAGVAANLRQPLTALHSAVTPELVEELPSLPAILDRLDEAMSGQQYRRARTQLADLVETVEFAQENQVVDDSAAEQLLAAAAALRAALPAPAPRPTTSPTATPGGDSSGSGDSKPPDRKKGGKKKGGGKGR